jgi:hypothetical protein
MDEPNFDAIRPYNFQEIQEAIPRIISDPSFHSMTNYLFSAEKKEELLQNLKSVKTINEFQVALTLPAVQSIFEKTTDGINHSGFDNIDKTQSYVYLANHRDIVLDSSILGAVLLQLGFNTPKNTWGSNLMVSPLIVDLGKSNQMITVFREGSPKELLQNSQRLSSFIRKSITDENKPVWIAHRKGRSKTGSDKTDVSILKMLTLSGNTGIVNKLTELNITPVTISYEWEPCDAMKVREIYLSKDNTYIKSADEDFKSILGGLTSDKGRVHISMGTPVNSELLEIDNTGINNNEFINMVAELIDKQIYNNYWLWPSNYLAYDLLNNTSLFADKYNDNTKEKFEKRYKKTAEISQHDNADIRELFLLLYANPVINKLKYNQE